MYHNVVKVAANAIRKHAGVNILVNGYTSAGHARQEESHGVTIVSSEESLKFIQSVTAKQSKKEGETQDLCQFWGGEGENLSLKDGERSIGRTSFTLLLFIQPKPFLDELPNLSRGEGIMDRMLALSVKPFKVGPTEKGKNLQKLQRGYPDDVIGTLAVWLYTYHNNNEVEYTLSDKADEIYTKILDNLAEDFNKRYASESKYMYMYIVPI